MLVVGCILQDRLGAGCILQDMQSILQDMLGASCRPCWVYPPGHAGCILQAMLGISSRPCWVYPSGHAGCILQAMPSRPYITLMLSIIMHYWHLSIVRELSYMRLVTYSHLTSEYNPNANLMKWLPFMPPFIRCIMTRAMIGRGSVTPTHFRCMLSAKLVVLGISITTGWLLNIRLSHF